jgi:NitT/TauT family transport system permease protein
VTSWIVLSWWVHDAHTLPNPLIVSQAIWSEFLAGELIYHVLVTLRRVAFAFVFAMGIGVVLGIILGLSRRLNEWVNLWVIIFLNLPALVVIVLCYLWIGLNEVAAIVAVAVNKIPMVTVMIREGTRALDPTLADMARIYRMPPTRVVRHIILPQLAPYLAGATRTGIALIWKIVLVVEFLGRSNGVGFQIHLYFQLFEIKMVLAYAISFVTVMLIIETVVIQPIEKWANRWRQQ